MGILKNQLIQSILGLKGQKPDTRQGALRGSTLHYQSSINNNPSIGQAPSNLDLDGKSPSKYTDNLPR